MGITINDPYTVNKITVDSGAVMYSDAAATTKNGTRMVVPIPIKYDNPRYCLMAKTDSYAQSRYWASTLAHSGCSVYTWVEQDELSFQDFKSLHSGRFLLPCFIRDVKFSYSERTGKTSTVMFFEDGTKTVSTPADGETFDPETGIEQCILKRVFGNRSQLKKVFKKYVPGYKAKEKASHHKASAADSEAEIKKAWEELVKSAEEGTERIKKHVDSLWVKEEEGRPWD